MTAHKARIYRKSISLDTFLQCLIDYLASTILQSTSAGKVGKAFSAGILTFLCVSTFSFMNCADEVNKKHEAIRFALQNQQFMKDMEEEENKRRN